MPTLSSSPGRWRARLLALRERPTWVLVHRWVGLAMTLFLIVAGLTGSLITFFDELDALTNPTLKQVQAPAPKAPLLDMVTLLERFYAARPDVVADSAIAPYRRDHALEVWVAPRDPAARVDYVFYLDPYTGAVLGSRGEVDLAQGALYLMPFIYELHYSLALGDIGILLFGIVALLWTLDCFVGVYLTLPRGRPFFSKWSPSWQIAYKRLNYDLHRAFGLWTWLLLFVLAWSSVALNLPQIYHPITDALLGYAEHDDHHHDHGDASAGPLDPPMGWRAGHARGKELMREAIAMHGIGAHREDALRYDRHQGQFNYWIATKFRNGDDAYDWFGVGFDATSGELREIHEEDVEPGRERAGDFVTRWLVDLHMARVWGLPYRIVVCVMGLVVAMLSITGLVIWWRKRRGRIGQRARRSRTA